MTKVTACVFTVLIGTAACTSTSSTTSQRNPDIITAEEIAGSGMPTAFEVIERLRPQFLRYRGPTSIMSPSPLVVYQDNIRIGGMEMLRQIRAADVREIRFLNAGDATMRFGTGHAGGVILITNRGR